MSGYRLLTIEFDSEKDIESYDPPEEWKVTDEKKIPHGRFLTIPLNNIDYGEYWQPLAEKIFEPNNNFSRIALCLCDDTTDTASFKLYEQKEDKVVEIDSISDYESVNLESKEDSTVDNTFGNPARKYLYEKYGFDAWSIWQVWEDEMGKDTDWLGYLDTDQS